MANMTKSKHRNNKINRKRIMPPDYLMERQEYARRLLIHARNAWMKFHNAVDSHIREDVNKTLDIAENYAAQNFIINDSDPSEMSKYHDIRRHGDMVRASLDPDEMAELNGKLLEYIRTGNISGIIEVIYQGADLNMPDEYGLTPMHEAMLISQLNINQSAANHMSRLIDILVKLGGDPNVRDSWTLMDIRRHGDMVRASLDPDEISELNEELFEYIWKGEVLSILKLISHGADPNAVMDKDGWTVMHYAALRGHLDVVKILIQLGVDVDSRNHNGWTPLYGAVNNGYPDVIKALVESGADVNAKDENGEIPIHIAVFKDYPDVVKVLIELGADINGKKNNGETPLHEATYWSHPNEIEIIRILVEFGADVNAKDKYGRTPLYNAVERNQSDAIKMLIKFGADINAKDEHGRTPLHLAAHKGHSDVVKMLIELGADPNIKDNHGDTPFDIGAMENYHDVVKILLSKLK